MQSLLRASIIAIAISVCVATPSFADDPYDTIVWANDEHTLAVFIPANVMESTPLDELPLTQAQLKSLNLYLDLYRNPPSNLEWLWPRGIPECMPDGYPPASTAPAPDARSLEMEVLRGEVALIGEVIAVVPGWYALLSHPESLAYIQTSRFLKNPGCETAHQTVAVLSSGARLEVAGVPVCSVPASDLFYQPQPGDQVLITGFPWHSDSTLIAPHKIFRIEHARILPQPYTSISTRSELPVDGLITAVSMTRRSGR